MNERCDCCKWWDTSSQSSHAAYVDETGACRAANPQTDDRTGLAMWPHTDGGSWCARYHPLDVRWPNDLTKGPQPDDDIPF